MGHAHRQYVSDISVISVSLMLRHFSSLMHISVSLITEQGAQKRSHISQSFDGGAQLGALERL